ncbi:MAG: hypothetical protein SPLUMA1_SPLUMAMAG1_00153 [uncultured Sulfurimonas sp.]|nr:MAG: hypothetical protein SPLUMA1_SPLUMAMAG1_00153 [uncultured Sulfurimonas sp.]
MTRMTILTITMIFIGLVFFSNYMQEYLYGKQEFSNLPKAEAADPSIDARSLYNNKCMKCHGKMGTQKVPATGLEIAGQAKEVLMAKINGYKERRYGGKLRGVMASQVSGLTPKEINAISEYVSKLK